MLTKYYFSFGDINVGTLIWKLQNASLSCVVQLFKFLLFTEIIVINPVRPFCSHVCVLLCIELMKTFFCLQSSLCEIPIISPSSFSKHFGQLLEEADEMDSIHDVTLQAGDRTFAAHKYILSMRSEFFRKLFVSEHSGIGEELGGEARKGEDAVGCDLIALENIPADMLEYALDFIYTDSCELLVHGAKPRVPVAPMGQTKVGKHKQTCQFICYRYADCMH